MGDGRGGRLSLNGEKKTVRKKKRDRSPKEAGRAYHAMDLEGAWRRD